MKRLWIVLPPKAEQAEILDFLERETGEIDETIEITTREIDLVREYRTRLIADVVTGKLDVHAVAAELPDESDEAEPTETLDALEDGEEEPLEAKLDAAEEVAV